jgi:hypothetical protein
LVSAAHEVRYVTLMAYGDAGETGDDDLLERLHDAEREIVVAVGHALWGIALDRLTESHLTHLGNALNALTRVAESLVRVAHPDVD